MTTEELLKRAEAIREKKGITKYQVETKSGIARNTVRSISKGNNVMLDKFLAYCNYIGIKIELK